MPRSNGSRYFKKLPLVVGILSGDSTYMLFKDVADVIRLRQTASASKLDLLMICSDTEFGMATCAEHIRLSKNKGTPTAFYDISGDYEINLSIAKDCDFVFCLSEAIQEKYLDDCGHECVYVLPHSVDPLVHNPIGCMGRTGEGVLYRGYCDRFVGEAANDMELLFDGCLDSGIQLRILDTQFGNTSKRYYFPRRYIPHITPDVGDKLAADIYKLYDYAIALNFEKYTNAIFIRSIYEHQACGNMMFSNYNIAVNEEFPNVRMFVSKDDIGAQIRSLTRRELAHGV
jgi:hypothetical protein